MSGPEEHTLIRVDSPQNQTIRLTQQFYDWEIYGRGWHVWDFPVALEPPFRPFLGHFLLPRPCVDDGRRHTLISTLIEKFGTLFKDPTLSSPVSSDTTLCDTFLDVAPDIYCPEEPLRELQVSLAPNQSISKDLMEQFLLGLTYCTSPLSFEVMGTSQSIVIQIACRESDLTLLYKNLKGYFPDAVIQDGSGDFRECWLQGEREDFAIIDFGLSQEFMLPLKVIKSFEVDPLIGIAAALSDLEDAEIGLFQVLFQAAQNSWAESIVRSVTDWEGRPFFADAPEMLSLAKQKVSRPLFAATIRVAARSSVDGRSRQIVKALGGALTQFSNPGSNELIPLSNEIYPELEHEEDLLNRQTHRSGMILNSEELLSLVHLPGPSVRSEKLIRKKKHTKTAPALALGNQLILGENYNDGKTNIVSLNPDQRTKHTYIIGASGTGKSTLLLNLIIQDINNGEGIAVLDPHGDLIDQILGHIPEKRYEDVILFDPSDEEYPIGFNILSAHSELEKNLLASDLGSVFRRLSTSWGDQMTSVLGNAILAFLESEEGGTLIHLRRFLVDKDFRRAFLKSIKDPEIVFYWEKEYPLLSGKPQAPVLTRLDTFLRPKPIRNMVSQKTNKLDFGGIMNQGKIFLAKLAQGAIGEENAYLLGTLLVSKFHQLAFSRQEAQTSQRKNFYLYVDEFQNFVTPSMESILSGARKYNLGLILAHQEFRQLLSKDTNVASAVISNPYTRVCFRLGDLDAQKLKDGFSLFEAKDLQNLGVGEAIGRIEQADYDFNLTTLPLPVLDLDLANQRKEVIIALSRKKYASKREDVESELANERIDALPSSSIPIKESKQEIPKEDFIPPPVKETLHKPALKRSKKLPEEPIALGRGGGQHKYLQQLIKRLAEDKGFRATIEKSVLDGTGKIDVALERDNIKIACKISITTENKQELSNVQKCLAAGYDPIILLSSEKKKLIHLREYISDQLDKENLKKVFFFLPEEFIGYLDQLGAQGKGKEETVRGYRVKVNYQAIGQKEQKTRREAIAQVILMAMKRLNKK